MPAELGDVPTTQNSTHHAALPVVDVVNVIVLAAIDGIAWKTLGSIAEESRQHTRGKCQEKKASQYGCTGSQQLKRCPGKHSGSISPG
jgi:hypothetical protein